MTDAQFARFVVKVDRSGGENACWNWTASRRPLGYGQFALAWRPSKIALAHRLAYEHWVGPIPDDRELDHLCRNPSCVNPKHLEPVTHRENILRGITGAKTAARNRASRGQPKGPRTPAHQAKLVAALHRNHQAWRGQQHSAETKAKMAEARRQYWARRKAVA